MWTRRVLLGVTIAAAIALPALVHFAQKAGHRHQDLKLALADLERQEADIGDYKRHVERFDGYVALLAEFSDAAERFDVTDAHWDSHQVDINKMLVSYAEIEGFLADMSAAQDSYFIPEKLHIHTRPTVTHEDRARAGGRTEVSGGGMVLSLTGEFMVKR